MADTDQKWFEFDRAFTFVPDENPNSSVKYPPGVYRVRRQCIDKALAVGAGRVVDTPQGSAQHGQSATRPELRQAEQKAVEVPASGSGGAVEGGGEKREVVREGGEETGGGEPEDG